MFTSSASIAVIGTVATVASASRARRESQITCQVVEASTLGK